MTLEWTERACPLCASPQGGARICRIKYRSGRTHGVRLRFPQVAQYMHPRLLECAECGMLARKSGVIAEYSFGSLPLRTAFDSHEESCLASFVYRESSKSIAATCLTGVVPSTSAQETAHFGNTRTGFSDVVGVNLPPLRSQPPGTEVRSCWCTGTSARRGSCRSAGWDILVLSGDGARSRSAGNCFRRIPDLEAERPIAVVHSQRALSRRNCWV